MRPARSARSLALGAAIIAVVATGCSSDDDAPANPPAQTETPDEGDDGNGALDGAEDGDIGDDGNGALDGAGDGDIGDDGNGALDGAEDGG